MVSDHDESTEWDELAWVKEPPGFRVISAPSIYEHGHRGLDRWWAWAEWFDAEEDAWVTVDFSASAWTRGAAVRKVWRKVRKWENQQAKTRIDEDQ